MGQGSREIRTLEGSICSYNSISRNSTGKRVPRDWNRALRSSTGYKG